MCRIDISKYREEYSLTNKMYRATWNIVSLLFFRTSPVICFAWRRLILRIFGAKIGAHASVYPTTRIWSPAYLEMGDYSCLSHFVDCYNPAKITLEAHSTVSQYSFLCTATHDITDPHMKLITAPITIKEGAWVCADVFVGPDVTISEGAVAGAGSVVLSNIDPWSVVAGNPAKFIKKRTLNEKP